MLQNIRNYLTHLPSTLKGGFVALMIGAIALVPIATQAAQDVQIEGSLGVANQTAGETDYSQETNASYNDFVVFQVYYHNQEMPDSGRNAENLRVNVDFPDQPGKNQVVSTTISADNSNTVNDQVKVNLDREDAKLDFVEGSVEWTHNQKGKSGVERCQTGREEAPEDCYNTETLSNDIVTSSNGAVLENKLIPCEAFAATLTFMARVKVPSVNVQKTVREKGETEWSTENTVDPGDTLEYQMKVENIGNQTLNNVLLGDNPPAHVTYVPGSTKLMNSNHPNGTTVNSDNITTGGINIGNIAQNGVTYVLFEAKVDEADQFGECGDWRLKNVAVVDSDETGPYENFAYTNVNVPCEEEPQFVCEDLSASPTSGQAPLEVTFTATADVSEDVDVQSYLWDFDNDGDTDFESSSNTTTHTYEEVGTHEASVRIRTSEGITDKTSDCVVKIEVKEKSDQPEENGDVRGDQDKPDQLAVTGPAETAAGFLGFGGLGIAIRGWLVSRRRLLEQLLS